MDDLSRNLGISKKTIYQFFENKDDLVMQWSINNLNDLKCQWETCSENAENAIDEVFIFLNKHMGTMIKMNPSVIHDLIKYHPACVNFLKEHRMKDEKIRAFDIIKRGINEGLFRSDLDCEIMSRYQTLMKDMCFNQESFPPAQFNVFYVMKELVINFLVGLSTLEGHKLIDKYRLEGQLEMFTLKNTP